MQRAFRPLTRSVTAAPESRPSRLRADGTSTARPVSLQLAQVRACLDASPHLRKRAPGLSGVSSCRFQLPWQTSVHLPMGRDVHFALGLLAVVWR